MLDANKILATKQYVDDNAGGSITVDQTYNPESANAQSGKAVAQAVDTCSPAIVTASDTGKALAINDSSESVLKGLTAYGESTQDGTPTPDSPVGIVSVENPTITIAGKNLFDTVNSALVRKGNANISERDSNSLTVVGTTTGTNTFYGLELPYIPEGTQVTLSATAEITGSNKGRVVFLWSSTTASFQETANTINFNPGVSSKKISFSVSAKPEGATTLALYLYANTNATITELPTVKYSNIQVEIGSVQTDFEPYTEPQTITIPYTFRGLKNSSGDWVARDELRVRGGKVEIVRNVDYLDCTSDLNWVKSSVTKSDLYSYENSELFGTSTNSTAFPKCTHFIAQWDTVVGHFYIAGGKAHFSYTEYGTTTLEDWKSFLDTANMYIIWASYKSTIEDITTTEAGQALLALKTNYPSTSVISDIDLDITYKADTKNYIDNKIAALTALTLEG